MVRKKTVVVCCCLFGLIAAGCSRGGSVAENTENSVALEETEFLENSDVEEESEKSVIEEEPVTATEVLETETPILNFDAGVENSDDVFDIPLSFSNEESTRITYTKNQNFVVYIKSAEELDAYDVTELSVYDEAFFSEKALVLLGVTTNSGSTKVGIQSIVQEGTDVFVTLSYEAPEIGTTDMATWYIWAEVDKGLEDYQWLISNPALDSNLEKK